MRYWVLASAVLASAAFAGEATPGWQFYQDKEATNGLLIAFVQSEDGTQLMLKCDKAGKNKVYAVIISQKKLAAPANKDVMRKISLRFDGGSVDDDRWRYFANTAKAVDYPGERSLGRLLEKMVDAKQLDVLLDPTDAQPISVSFDVHDSRLAIDEVFKSCKDQNPLD